MFATHLVYPMAAMVLLTVVILVSLFRSRVAAVRAGQIDKRLLFPECYGGGTRRFPPVSTLPTGDSSQDSDVAWIGRDRVSRADSYQCWVLR